MSKRFSVLRCAATAMFASLAVSLLMTAPVRAADSAPAASPKDKQAQPAATPKSPKPVAAPKTPKPAKVKSPRPPEKSIEEQRAADGPWAKRTNWLSLRAGYAKATGDFAGDGLVGYGMAYQRMLTTKYGFGGSVQHDLVGHLGSAYEISVPFTLELTRHFKWSADLRPYVGVGGGYYFHKYYRTAGTSTGSPGHGIYVNFGTNLPMNARNLLGVDARVSFVSTTEGAVNPVFGTAKASETLWSVKLNWAFAY